MKIVVVAQEFPFPAIHGGRVDIWNRVRALKRLGVDIFFVTWIELIKGDKPSQREISEVEKYVKVLRTFSINRDIKRVKALLTSPSLVAARNLDSTEKDKLLEELTIFQPDLIFVDGLYGGDLGLWLKEKLKIPLGVRSHNIEHLYMKGQFRLASDFKSRLSIGLALLHLNKFEIEVLQKADCFFDISKDDLNFWKNKGLNNGVWLGPTRINTESFSSGVSDKDIDIGFFGNLNTPNNVEALRWFIDSVLPLLVNDSLKILVMGSNPSSLLKKWVELNTNILLIENPSNPQPYLDRVKVMINPVQFGSGVNIKSVDMLFQNSHVVSTSVGIQGLPEEMSKVFEIADTPHDFANKIRKCLSTHSSGSNKVLREELRKQFDESNVNIIFKCLASKELI